MDIPRAPTCCLPHLPALTIFHSDSDLEQWRRTLLCVAETTWFFAGRRQAATIAYAVYGTMACAHLYSLRRGITSYHTPTLPLPHTAFSHTHLLPTPPPAPTHTPLLHHLQKALFARRGREALSYSSFAALLTYLSTMHTCCCGVPRRRQHCRLDEPFRHLPPVLVTPPTSFLLYCAAYQLAARFCHCRLYAM